MRRGEIWWASLPNPTGSGPGFRRPLLVVSADSFNRSRIATVVAAVITSNVQLAEAPGNVRCGGRGTGLTKSSVVNVSQLITVDKAVLTARAGRLAANHLELVEQGIRLVLGLR